MTTLSAGQIATVAQAAGFSGGDLVKAVAIALAESGGRTDATNHNTNGSSDYGLWQINSVHADLLNTGDWSDPADNARMAYRVYADAGNSFSPWVTYTTGAWAGFVGRATQGANNPADVGAVSGATGGMSAGLSGLGGGVSAFDALAMFTDPGTWVRVAMFIGGSMLLVWALLSLTNLDNTLGRVAKNVGMAIATDGGSVVAKGAKAAVA